MSGYIFVIDRTWPIIVCACLCKLRLEEHLIPQNFKSKYAALRPVFKLPGGWGVEPPTSSCRPPLPLVKIRHREVEFQPPHLSFAEVGMLLDSHFLLMQFLKYLGLHHDDLNITTS